MKAWIISILLSVSGFARGEEMTALRWGEFGFHTKWAKPTSAVESKYPFLMQLPALDQFPQLLKLAESPSWKDEDKKILITQLATLSRCDFTPSGLVLMDVNKEFAPAIERWRKWWNFVGKSMLGNLRTHGHTYPEAWAYVVQNPYLACPDYPLLLPDAWSLQLSFQSGDYGGVVREVLKMTLRKEDAELKRYYRIGWPGQARTTWKAEVWQGFDRKEAQFFFAALTYAIDNPWFFLRQKIGARNQGDNSQGPWKFGHIEKRPEAWTDYYPGVHWSGVLDDKGRVIMNDDVATWHTSMHEAVGETNLDYLIGVVYRLLLDRYPDPSWDEELSRWKRRDMTPEEAKDLDEKP